jgi:hypothetical protein
MPRANCTRSARVLLVHSGWLSRALSRHTTRSCISAKEKAQRLLASENVAGGLGKPPDLEQTLREAGATAKDIEHLNVVGQLDDDGLKEYLAEFHSPRAEAGARRGQGRAPSSAVGAVTARNGGDRRCSDTTAPGELPSGRPAFASGSSRSASVPDTALLKLRRASVTPEHGR